MTLFAIVFERKVVARMQQRIGPNRVGPRGYLQSLADGLKLAFKEDIMPALADRPVYFLAPVIATIPAFLAFSVIPLGPTVSIFGHRTPLQLTDAPIGVLVVLACSAMGVYGIVLAGWASGSTYPLLGGLRSAAQMVSYEIAMGLSIVAVFLYAGSMSTSEIVAAQANGTTLSVFGARLTGPSWFAVLLPVSFVIYVDRRRRRDQPGAVRPARGRERTGRRLPHRVLVAEVRAVLPGRVRQHGHRLRAGRDAVPGRLAGAVADLDLERRKHRLVAAAVVLPQGRRRAVRVHLAARHPAPAALRPVHALRLEGAGADGAGLDPRGRHDAHRLPGGRPEQR